MLSRILHNRFFLLLSLLCVVRLFVSNAYEKLLSVVPLCNSRVCPRENLSSHAVTTTTTTNARNSRGLALYVFAVNADKPATTQVVGKRKKEPRETAVHSS